MLKPFVWAALFVALVRTADGQVAAPADHMAYNEGGKWGFADRALKNEKWIIAPAYESAYPFAEGRAAVRKDGKWGFIDETGKVVIDFQHTALVSTTFQKGVALVRSEKYLVGAIDRDGKQVLPTDNVTVWLDADDERLLAMKPAPEGQGRMMAVFDLTGKAIVPFQAGEISRFNKGVAVVWQGDKKGLIDKNGKALTEIAYEGLFRTEAGHFYGEKKSPATLDVFDAAGKLIFTTSNVSLGTFYDGRGAFKDADTKRWGYLDETGKVAIKPEFFMAVRFSEGLAIVRRTNDGPLEFIDAAGKSVAAVPNVFSSIDRIENGNVWLQDRTTRRSFFYDKKGQRVHQTSFLYASAPDANGLMRAYNVMNTYGLINMKGEWVVQPGYELIQRSSVPGLYILQKKGGIRSIVTAEGKFFLTDQPVRVDDWDAEFLRISPGVPKFDNEYWCFIRKDGTGFYTPPAPAEPATVPAKNNP